MTDIAELRRQVQELKEDVEQTKFSVYELNTALRRYLALSRRFGLPEPIMDAMVRLQQLRLAIIITYRSLMALYAASGPIGWATAIGGLVLGGMMLSDQMGIMGADY